MKNIDRAPRNLISAGKPLTEASNALVLVHGRGANAGDILSLTEYLSVDDFALLAPQAANGSWYPLSFLAAPEKNEPWLSSALNFLNEVIDDLHQTGIRSEKIFFLGFSQGACLVLEFVARHAQHFGGVVALTGGLIGDKVHLEHYQGDFERTRIFIGTSDPDPHVPLQRVKETAELLRKMNADLTLKVYPGMGHTINEDEIKTANAILLSNRDAENSAITR